MKNLVRTLPLAAVALVVFTIGARSVDGGQPVEEDVPSLTLPKEVEAEVGEPVTIEAVTNGKFVRWVSPDKGLIKFPEGQLKSTNVAVVWSLVPGTYRLIGYTALGDVPSDPKICIIKVGHGPQPPPTPVPVPPAPVPPTPTPTPPAPVNPTAEKLHVVIIHDVIEPKAVIAMLDSGIWDRQVSGKGHTWRRFNVGTVASQPYREQEQIAGGTPFVLIYDAVTSKWLNTDKLDMRLPTTEAGLGRLIDKYTRK